MNLLPDLSNISLNSLSISGIILGTLAVVIVVYTAITAILSYHWKKYSITKEESRRMRVVYSFVSIFLWIIIITSGIQSLTGI